MNLRIEDYFFGTDCADYTDFDYVGCIQVSESNRRDIPPEAGVKTLRFICFV